MAMENNAFPHKRLWLVLIGLGVLAVTIYVWLALTARDEAGQARQQAVVDSVVRAMDDSLRADHDLRRLMLDEQARTDSALHAEADIAAKAEADRKVNFLWSVMNEAVKKGSDNARRAVFERKGTADFRRFLKQREAALPELLFFPLEDLASTSIWHYQQDWFAVSTPPMGSIVLRVISSNGSYFIDDIRQASRPVNQQPDEDEYVEEDEEP